MEHRAALHAMRSAERAIQYVVAASAVDGRILCEVGDKAALPHHGILGYALAPEGVMAFHEEILRYRAEGPSFVPRLYAQGRVQGVIDSPIPNLVVFAFGVMPESVGDDEPRARAEWMWRFRGRVKAALDAAFASA